jgi:hypothetical protein
MGLSFGAAPYTPGGPFLPSRVRRTKDFPSAMTWPVLERGCLRRLNGNSDPYVVPRLILLHDVAGSIDRITSLRKMVL